MSTLEEETLDVIVDKRCPFSPSPAWDTRVGVFSANTVDYPTVIWASHRLGAVVSAANPAFQPSELSYQLDASKATVLFVNQNALQAGFDAAQKAGIQREHVIVVQDPAIIHAARQENGGQTVRRMHGAWTLAGLVEEGGDLVAQHGRQLVAQCRRTLKAGEAKSKLALLSFSSGTTGLPKGVAIQHYAPISNVLQFQYFNRVENKLKPSEGRFRPGRDVALGVLPMFHIYGLVLGLHGMFYFGLSNVVMPRFRGIVPMLDSCLKYRISIWFLVPPQVVLFCKQAEAKAYHERCRALVNFVMIGAAPLSDDLSKLFDAALPNLDWGQGYGMTETSTLTLMHPTNVRCVLGSAGRLVSNVDARIVSPDGKNLGLDEPGELWVRSPSNTLGYSNNAEATREMFLPGNWVRTGDEAKANAQGDFFIVDRLKVRPPAARERPRLIPPFPQELIKVKGFQVAPAELEGWLLNHPDGMPACRPYSPPVLILSSASLRRHGRGYSRRRCRRGAARLHHPNPGCVNALPRRLVRHAAGEAECHEARERSQGAIQAFEACRSVRCWRARGAAPMLAHMLFLPPPAQH